MDNPLDTAPRKPNHFPVPLGALAEKRVTDRHVTLCGRPHYRREAYVIRSITTANISIFKSSVFEHRRLQAWITALYGLKERKLIQLGLVTFLLCHFADDKVEAG